MKYNVSGLYVKDDKEQSFDAVINIPVEDEEHFVGYSVNEIVKECLSTNTYIVESNSSDPVDEWERIVEMYI